MPVIPVAIVVLVLGAIALAKRMDIRLVLMGAAAVLFALRATQAGVAGQRFDAFAQFFIEFAKGITYPPAVVPICSAMGFAYVCKLTECDAHLVHLLIGPIRKIRWLLIPGGIAVAFFVNSAIVSQTSTVSVVGPVIIPLLMAAGVSRITAGALLLLGGSMGGELLNPAAVEVAAIKMVTGREATDIIAHLLPYNLLASGTALLVFWAMSFWYERRGVDLSAKRQAAGDGKEDVMDVPSAAPGSIAATMSTSVASTIERVNPFKAMVPLIPIFLLIVVKRVLVHLDLLPPALTPGPKNEIGEQAAIAAAMLIGVVCAGLTSLPQATRLPVTFFEGAGFAFAHVISVIAAARMFAQGIQVNGLIDRMTPHLQNAPVAITAASVVIPWLMACVTGTAVGTAPLVINIILPIAMGANPKSAAALATGVRLGSVNAIAAQFGRTSSPVAPVTIMCATLARARPIDLVWRVTPPLVAGAVVLFLAALWSA